MLPASPVVPSFRCPGESYDIPQPVHVARLAAGYSRCRDCRHAPGRLVLDSTTDAEPEPLDASHHIPWNGGRRSLFTDEGIRGIYLNELTRAVAGAIAGAFASYLWEEAGEVSDSRGSRAAVSYSTPQSAVPGAGEGIEILPVGRPGPAIVLAQDERPPSPDLVMGVGMALRRMGCQVIDIGPATRPGFWFAVDHLRAAGGIQVTGAGCDTAWTGLDFVRRGAHPCSRGAGLERIEHFVHTGSVRPNLRPGSQRLLSTEEAYEAGLRKHIHALRPLRIVLGSPQRMLREMLSRLLRKSACRLIPVDIPTRERQLDNPRDPDILRVAAAVRSNEAHLGILVDDDAQRCAVFDNFGQQVPPAALLELLATQECEARPSGTIVWEGEAVSSAAAMRRFAASQTERASLAAMSAALREPEIICGGDASGRCWFPETYPVCDAALTIIKLLQTLSRSDTPLADLLRGASSR